MPEASSATGRAGRAGPGARGARARRARRPARKPGLFDLAAARKELGAKGILDIERATALTWGGRAAVSYESAAQAKDRREWMRRLQEAENYRQEALEHAAMAEDLGFFAAVRDEVEAYRKPATAATRQAA